jgi:PTS system mannose-specific IID component
MTEAAKISLTKRDRLAVFWKSTFLQGSWNYERMQNLGWAYAMGPALKKLYTEKEDLADALETHMEFFNTHPYIASPIIGVTLVLEEAKANGAPIEDSTIQGVKIGMMGPLAGVGDPVFWFTIKPILGALGASLAIAGGNILGPILFFVLWNAIRLAFMWNTQELGYKQGSKITEDLSGGILQDLTKGAGILGMFVVAVLIERWVSVSWALDYNPGKDVNGIQLDHIVLQQQLDNLIPGLTAVILTLVASTLLKKKVSPVILIIGLFVIGVVFHAIGLM